MPNTNIKTGILTSEFWLAFVQGVTGFLVLLGYLTPQQADEFGKAIVSVMGGLITIAGLVTYLYGRVVLKKAAIENGAPIEGVPATPVVVNTTEELIQYPL